MSGMRGAVAVLVVLVVVSGCVGAGGNTQSGPEAGDGSEGGNGSDGGVTVPEVDAPEPYTDGTVGFVIDGEVRGAIGVEVPRTPEGYERGMMGRESVPEDAGMLFIYSNDVQRRYWMKDTLVPLDIVFVDANGTVLNVEHASPGFEGRRVCDNPDYYCSDGPARYVVETHRGYANETGLSSGDRLVVSR